MNDELNNTISNQSNDRLIGMIENQSEYRPEAIEIALCEITRRGGLDTMRAKVQQELAESQQAQQTTKRERVKIDGYSAIGGIVSFPFAIVIGFISTIPLTLLASWLNPKPGSSADELLLVGITGWFCGLFGVTWWILSGKLASWMRNRKKHRSLPTIE